MTRVTVEHLSSRFMLCIGNLERTIIILCRNKGAQGYAHQKIY